MALNDKKIVSIILDQSNDLEERCKGYQPEIVNVISDILIYERQHRVSATNVQKKIDDKFNAAAHFLNDKRKEASNE